jgi:CBS domain-containing protein
MDRSVLAWRTVRAARTLLLDIMPRRLSMEIVAVMSSRSAAERAVARLERVGIPPGAVRLVFPDDAWQEPPRVPSTDTEAPGVGPVLGGVVGAAGGASIGAAAVSVLVPGVGPVMVFSSLAAALIGAVSGAAGGWALGQTLEENLGPEIPTDELYIYRDALSQGRFLVVATVEETSRAEAVRGLRAAGAESVDAARADRAVGLQSADQNRYSPETTGQDPAAAGGRPKTGGQVMKHSIRNVMTPNPTCLAKEATLLEAARAMRDGGIGDVIVLDGETVSGILTDRDIVVRAVAEGRDPARTRISEVCSRELTTLSPGDTTESAVRIMREKAIRRIPVVEKGKPVGIVSIGDLAVERDPESVLGAISAAPPNV